jgi:hypothetical protein
VSIFTLSQFSQTAFVETELAVLSVQKVAAVSLHPAEMLAVILIRTESFRGL